MLAQIANAENEQYAADCSNNEQPAGVKYGGAKRGECSHSDTTEHSIALIGNESLYHCYPVPKKIMAIEGEAAVREVRQVANDTTSPNIHSLVTECLWDDK
ncbi:hypothetical protein [Ensifer sp. M14]|uniref:hypothetical protein n=1 Tax=Ensifer sp. M14 TaxID=2203782 RepID=UPI001FCE6E2A|nr:hypothetical protein [Ensifer sp. M14]